MFLILIHSALRLALLPVSLPGESKLMRVILIAAEAVVASASTETAHTTPMILPFKRKPPSCQPLKDFIVDAGPLSPVRGLRGFVSPPAGLVTFVTRPGVEGACTLHAAVSGDGEHGNDVRAARGAADANLALRVSSFTVSAVAVSGESTDVFPDDFRARICFCGLTRPPTDFSQSRVTAAVRRAVKF